MGNLSQYFIKGKTVVFSSTNNFFLLIQLKPVKNKTKPLWLNYMLLFFGQKNTVSFLKLCFSLPEFPGAL